MAYEMAKDPATGKYRMMLVQSDAADAEKAKKRKDREDKNTEAFFAASTDKSTGRGADMEEKIAKVAKIAPAITADMDPLEVELLSWQKTAAGRMYARGPPGDNVRLTLSVEVGKAALKAASEARDHNADPNNKREVNKPRRGSFPPWEEIKEYLGCSGEVVQFNCSTLMCRVRFATDGNCLRIPIEMLGKSGERDPWLAKREGEDERVKLAEEKEAKELEERLKRGGGGGPVRAGTMPEMIDGRPAHLAGMAPQMAAAVPGYGMPMMHPGMMHPGMMHPAMMHQQQMMMQQQQMHGGWRPGMPAPGYGHPGMHPGMAQHGYGHPGMHQQAYGQHPGMAQQQRPGMHPAAGQPAPPAAAPQAQNPWKAVQDGQGRTYYHNTISNTTQWDKPAGMP